MTGRDWDADADLYYYRARWYDPAIGQFISEDPLGFGAGDANLHRHVGNSPVTFVDPSGLTVTSPLDNVFGTGNGVDDNRNNGARISGNGADRNGASSGRDGNTDRKTEGMEPFFVLEMPWWKRGIDIIGSVTGLILTSPILLATALAIKMTSPGPVLFRQRRSGAGDQPFVIYKFRTMRTGAEDCDSPPLSDIGGVEIMTLKKVRDGFREWAGSSCDAASVFG